LKLATHVFLLGHGSHTLHLTTLKYNSCSYQRVCMQELV
jgi:hypothetical protein